MLVTEIGAAVKDEVESPCSSQSSSSPAGGGSVPVPSSSQSSSSGSFWAVEPVLVVLSVPVMPP